MRWFSIGLVPLCLACGAPAETPLDASQPADAGFDAGIEPDAGTPDLGPPDAGADPLRLADCEATPAAPAQLEVLSLEAGAAHTFACAARALDDRLQNTRVICLGENDHGVVESSFGHGMVVRYLVHQHRVRTVAFEATEASMDAWSAYLVSGDAADLEAGFADARGNFGDSIPLEQLTIFLKSVQDELPPGERLTISGFDVSVGAQSTVASLLAFFDQVDPNDSAMWQATLSGSAAQIAAGASNAYDQLQTERARYVEALGSAAVERAERDALNLRDGQSFLAAFFAGEFETANATYREPGMVRNANAMLTSAAPEDKVLLIGHNFHCSKDLIIGNDAQGQPTPAMGTALTAQLDAGYATIGQFYREGSYLARGQQGYAVRPYPGFSAGSFERQLFDAFAAEVVLSPTEDSSLIDMQGRYTTSWDLLSFVPANSFDAVLGIRSVTATTLR